MTCLMLAKVFFTFAKIYSNTLCRVGMSPTTALDGPMAHPITFCFVGYEAQQRNTPGKIPGAINPYFVA